MTLIVAVSALIAWLLVSGVYRAMGFTWRGAFLVAFVMCATYAAMIHFLVLPDVHAGAAK